MTNLPSSPFKSPEGEAEYMAAYEATLRLWPVPYEPMDIPGRYGRTHLVATGPNDAPTLVLLHMYLANLTMWAANIADFSRDYRVYAIDVIGQPNKSIPDQPLRNRQDCVAWLSEAAQTNKWTSCASFVGSSSPSTAITKLSSYLSNSLWSSCSPKFVAEMVKHLGSTAWRVYERQPRGRNHLENTLANFR